MLRCAAVRPGLRYDDPSVPAPFAATTSTLQAADEVNRRPASQDGESLHSAGVSGINLC